MLKGSDRLSQTAMYSGFVNSPPTTLSSSIDSSQTIINIVDGTKLPDAPNLAIIGVDSNAETVLYTGKNGNQLTGCIRGFQNSASAWNSGVSIMRAFTAYDHDTFKANIEDIVAEISDQDWGLITGSATSTDDYGSIAS